MRILHVETGRHAYGGAQQVRMLLAGLARRGVDNVLVCPPEQPLTSDSAVAGAARIVTLPARGDLDAALVGRLLRCIRDLRPDLVHVHSRRGADLYGGVAAALAGVPSLLTRRVESREPGFWLRLKCRPFRAVAAISTAVARELEKAGVPAARRRLIPSAVDTSQFRPRPDAARRLRATLAIPAGAPVAGIVAQLIPRKGHAVAIEALARLPQRHRELRLVCFGRGPLASSLARLAADCGLAARVVMAGFRDDMAELLPGVDVLLHPAAREGLGVAVLEAMSAGVPVVAAATGGITDLIRADRDGRLVAPGDAAALATALAGLLDDPASGRRLAATARDRVGSVFSIDAMTDAYLAAYEAVLEPADGLLGH